MRKVVLLSCLFSLGGCAALAISAAPTKVPTPQSREGKLVAERFWAALHGGRYDELDGLLEEHLQVALKEPADPITVSHVGWLHAWATGERARLPPRASVVSHIPLARRYFEEAVALDPAEPRYLGFLASFTLAEGSVLKNERVTRTGYFQMKDAVAAWPEFNLFTSGYVMSAGPVDQPPFQEGLEQQWKTLELCFQTKPHQMLTERTLRGVPEVHEGHQRACWNSWIAPHNVEGFLLNFGDMLVRAGDLPNARASYQAAKASATYDQWPYRAVLERRLATLDSLPARFAAASPTEPEYVTMFNSAFACTGCHQATGTPAVSP
jgi:hypothetical protein